MIGQSIQAILSEVCQIKSTDICNFRIRHLIDINTCAVFNCTLIPVDVSQIETSETPTDFMQK